MILIPFICLSVICVAMGVMNTIFHNLTGWKAIVVRGVTMVSLTTFALVISNLRGITNAFPLFIGLAFVSLLLSETIETSMPEDEKLKPIIRGVFYSISCILFALSAASLAEFSVLALLGGLFAGIGSGLIICAIKKEKGLNQIIMNISTLGCVGLLIGLSFGAVVNSQHLASALLMLLGGLMLLAHRLLIVCGRGKVVVYITHALYSLALILMAASIYFY